MMGVIPEVKLVPEAQLRDTHMNNGDNTRGEVSARDAAEGY